MEASSVTNLLFKNLNFRGERQKVISSNIANINTPGYKTQELVFNDEMKKANENMQVKLQLSQTNNNHLPIASNANDKNLYKAVEIKGLKEQNDGNNVNLDSQMAEMSKNKMLFDAIQSSIKKDSRLFRSVIESSSKN